MLEDFINALKNFKTNKMRTILSLLGIIIGVTSVVIITTLGHSLQKSIEATFEDFKMEVLTADVSTDRRGQPNIKLNDEFKTLLKNRVPEIANVFFVNEGVVQITREGVQTTSGWIETAEPNRLERLGLKIDYGNFFEPVDYIIGANKIILGDLVVRELFPDGKAVGKNLTLTVMDENNIKRYNFEVVGVLAKNKNWAINSGGKIYITKTAFERFPAKVTEGMSRIQIIARNTDDVLTIKRKVTQLGRELAPMSNAALQVSSIKEQMDYASQSVNMVRFVIVAIAGISLLVGGIGIMNIMLVTVTERKKEIGIRKALGATNLAIKLQFLIESATLTLTGGIIGVLLGMIIGKVLITMVIPSEASLTFHFDLQGTIIAFVVSAFIGIFFGLHPASKAAKLDPVVALAE